VTGAGFSESQSVIDDSLCATTLNLIEVKIRSLNVRFGSMLLKKGSWFWANDDSVCWMILSGGALR